MLWDLNIQTGRVIETRIPDLVVVDKDKRNCQIIYFTVQMRKKINM